MFLEITEEVSTRKRKNQRLYKSFGPRVCTGYDQRANWLYPTCRKFFRRMCVMPSSLEPANKPCGYVRPLDCSVLGLSRLPLSLGFLSAECVTILRERACARAGSDPHPQTEHQNTSFLYRGGCRPTRFLTRLGFSHHLAGPVADSWNATTESHLERC